MAFKIVTYVLLGVSAVAGLGALAIGMTDKFGKSDSERER